MNDLLQQYPIAASRLIVLICDNDLECFERTQIDLSKVVASGQNLCEIEDCKWCDAANWGRIWAHAIQCHWGACYNHLFDDVIQSHFKNPTILDAILRSEVIRDKGEILVGRNGARIFKDLFDRLLMLENPVVTLYVRENFAVYSDFQ